MWPPSCHLTQGPNPPPSGLVTHNTSAGGPWPRKASRLPGPTAQMETEGQSQAPVSTWDPAPPTAYQLLGRWLDPHIPASSPMVSTAWAPA